MENNRFKVGNKFKKPYPFKLISTTRWNGSEMEPDEFWQSGCHRSFEAYGEYDGEVFWNADGEGMIEYEVLAVVEMPRKYQTRIIYRFSMTDPDGDTKHSSKDFTASVSRFAAWVDAGHSPFPYDYEVE